MGTDQPSARYDRVLERRHAAALTRHLREAEGLSIAQIAARLGRSPATIKAYLYDPSDANKTYEQPRTLMRLGWLSSPFGRLRF